MRDLLVRIALVVEQGMCRTKDGCLRAGGTRPSTVLHERVRPTAQPPPAERAQMQEAGLAFLR
jgi:hypothetical protein